jgi:hypothetical protein
MMFLGPLCRRIDIKSLFASSRQRASFVLELAGLASHKGTGFGNAEQEDERKLMPTLFRFVVTLAILAGIAYGTMFALVMFVEPKKAEMSVRIPPEKLNPKKN